jgi:acetyl esterase/lipase
MTENSNSTGGGLQPDIFRPEAIAPETSAFNVELQARLAQAPPIHTMQPRAIRAASEAGAGLFGPAVPSSLAKERSIETPAGALTLRVLTPDQARGVYFHIHGGGHVLGRPIDSDAGNEAIARRCSLAVVSVEYRLAPEHPYPAGPDDCEAAAAWLAEHALSEFGTERLLIGGESAGANLAALTLIRMRDKHSYTGFAAANLVFGVYDLSGTPSVRRWGDRELVLNAKVMSWFADHYVPAERRREEDGSPLYADLSRMPPALFTVGTLDPLLDDSLFMHARWVAAGNDAEPGGVHGFTGFPYPLAHSANARIEAFLMEHTV